MQNYNLITGVDSAHFEECVVVARGSRIEGSSPALGDGRDDEAAAAAELAPLTFIFMSF